MKHVVVSDRHIFKVRDLKLNLKPHPFNQSNQLCFRTRKRHARYKIEKLNVNFKSFTTTVLKNRMKFKIWKMEQLNT